MKNVMLITLALVVATLSTNAQNKKYEEAMLKNIVLLDSAKKATDFNKLAANFSRIGMAEKNQWLPYYYAGYAKIMEGFSTKVKAEMEKNIKDADSFIVKATALDKENSEISTLIGMLFSLKMQADQSTFMTNGPAASAAYGRAIKSDSTNPRPYTMLAQNLFYTPAQFGGGKDKAKAMLAKAERLFGTFKPAGKLHPNWGKFYLLYIVKPMMEK
jgi:hypothetical protein